MSALRELLAAFSIDVDSSELEKGAKAIDEFKATLKEAAEFVAEAFAIDRIKDFVGEQIEAGAQMKIMAERLGTTTDELQSMELAAGEAGVSVDAMTTALRFLNRNLGEAASGGEKAAIFRKLGIAIKDASGQARPAGDVMGDLADHIAEIPSQAEKTNLAMKLLGRGGAELIPLLNRGGEAFEGARKSMQELGGGLSNEFVESAHEAEAANVRLEFSMKGLKAQIANALLPGFSATVEWLTKETVAAVKATKETTGLASAVEFFGTVAAVKAVSGLVPLIQKLAVLDIELFGAEIPIWAVVAGLAVLYLAFDDMFALLNGGESVIGDTLDHFFGLGTAAQFAKELSESLSATGDVVVDLGALVGNALITPFEFLYNLAKTVGAVLERVASGDFSGASKSLEAGLASAQKDYDSRNKAIYDREDNLASDVTDSKDQRDRKRGRGRYADAPGLKDADTEEAQVERGKFAGPPQSREEEKARAGTEEDLARRGGFSGPPRSVADEEERQAPKTSIYGDAHYRGEVAVVPKAVEAIAGAGAGGGLTVSQQNTTKVEVHTSDNPRAVGDAVSQGVSTANERALARARTALRTP